MPSITIKKIEKAKGAKYRLDYYTPWGQRRRVTVPSMKEAEEIKRTVLLGFIGADLTQAQMALITIADAVRKYTELVSARRASRESFKQDKQCLQRLYDFLFDQGLTVAGEIEPIHLEALQRERAKAVANATINREFNVYRPFFKALVRWGFLAKSPIAELPQLAESPKERLIWRTEQVSQVLEKLPKCYGDFMFAMAHGGFRNSELRRLNWADVDFGQGVVWARSVKGGRGEKKRAVPMSGALRALLSEIREERFAKGMARATDAVFVNRFGNPIFNQALNDAVRAAREELGIEEKLTPYGLRHFLVTSLHEANESVEKIRMIAGHSPGSAVTSRYTHLGIESLREAIERTPQAQEVKRDGRHWAPVGKI